MQMNIDLNVFNIVVVVITGIVVLAAIIGFIWGCVTDKIPYPGKFPSRHTDVPESITPITPRKHVDNTHLIILKNRVKNRGRPWPKVEDPKWIQRKRDNEKQQLHIPYGPNINMTAVDEFIVPDTSDLYEVEPHTGRQKKVNSSYAKKQDNTEIDCDLFQYDLSDQTATFYFNRSWLKFVDIEVDRIATFKVWNPAPSPIPAMQKNGGYYLICTAPIKSLHDNGNHICATVLLKEMARSHPSDEDIIKTKLDTIVSDYKKSETIRRRSLVEKWSGLFEPNEKDL